MAARGRSAQAGPDSEVDKVSVRLLDVNLPYSRGFLERVPVGYVNLPDLASAALECRDMHGDALWKVETRSEIVACAFARKGHPYSVVGKEVARFDDLVTWIQKESPRNELFLTLRFLHEGSLPYAVRCMTEEPVLCRLHASSGQVMEIFDSMRERRESGLLRLSYGDSGALVPVEEGKPAAVWLPGASMDREHAAGWLKNLREDSEGYFYGGTTEPLPAVGLAEIPVVLGAFNNWFVRICGIWQEGFGISVNLFAKLREKKPEVQNLVLKPSGLSLRGPFAEPGSLPGLVIVLTKAIAKKHEDPARCMKYFREVNMASRTALQAMGLGQLMGRND